MKTTSSIIGFRLDAEWQALLLQRASALNVSVHELARHYVLLVLGENGDRNDLRDSLLAMQKEMMELRKDIALSSEAVLSFGGKITPEEARRWVDTNLGGA